MTKLETMNLDYSSINIFHTVREGAKVTATLKLFGRDTTVLGTTYGSGSGCYCTTVTIDTTDPKRTADSIGRHLSYDTIIAPRVFFT